MTYEKVGPVFPADTGTLTDRRRPGRVDFQNPHLVELLREPDNLPPPAEPAEKPFETDFEAYEDEDPLRPARGILLGMVIASGLWAAGALALWMLF
jgi:hypothetical protein